MQNTFSYDVRLSQDQYDQFAGAEDGEALRILVEVLLSSLSKTDKLSKQAPDFDIETFRTDMESACRSLAM